MYLLCNRKFKISRAKDFLKHIDNRKLRRRKYIYQINGFILDVVEFAAFTGGSRHSDAGKKESEEEEKEKRFRIVVKRR